MSRACILKLGEGREGGREAKGRGGEGGEEGCGDV